MKRYIYLLVLGTALLGGTLVSQGGEAVHQFGKPRLVCTIHSKEITESSGIAPSNSRPGHYYTHNDSGDTARFFEFDLTGKVLAEYKLEDTKARDWEDIETRTIGGANYLYIGDIGDNKSKREHIKIYRFPEPEFGKHKIKKFETYTLRYPDGAHNCECLMVQPGTGDIWLVTKVFAGSSEIFRLKAPKSSGDYRLTKVGEAIFGDPKLAGQMVTAGTFSADGKRVLILTYRAAFEFAWSSNGKWFENRPTRISFGVLDQAEGICCSRDGKSILVTSEGKHCPVIQIPTR